MLTLTRNKSIILQFWSMTKKVHSNDQEKNVIKKTGISGHKSLPLHFKKRLRGPAHFPKNKWTLKSCSTKIFF